MTLPSKPVEKSWQGRSVGRQKSVESVGRSGGHSRQTEEQMQMWQNIGKYGLLGSSMQFHGTWNRDEDVGREPGTSGRCHWHVDRLESLYRTSFCTQWEAPGESRWVCVLNNSLGWAVGGGCRNVEGEWEVGVIGSRKTVRLPSIS